MYKQSPIIWIVRHGKTLLNELNRVQGWCDAPLTSAGLATIERLAHGLSEIPFDAVYSSDSGRAIETAQIIVGRNCNQQSLKVISDMRLREYCFGSYEATDDVIMKHELASLMGITEAERQATTRPSIFTNNMAKLDVVKRRHNELQDVPFAENFEILTQRLLEVLGEIVERAQSLQLEHILLISHGVAIWSLWEKINSLAGYDGNGIVNGSVMKLKYEHQAFIMLTANDTSYCT